MRNPLYHVRKEWMGVARGRERVTRAASSRHSPETRRLLEEHPGDQDEPQKNVLLELFDSSPCPSRKRVPTNESGRTTGSDTHKLVCVKMGGGEADVLKFT